MSEKRVIKVVLNALPSLIIDFFPVFLFVLIARHGQVYTATIALMLATILATMVVYTKERRLPYITLYICFITILFGTLTVVRHHIGLIQIRDTLYDLSFALLLGLGLIFKVSFLKLSFENILTLSDKGWRKLTYFWIGFFISTTLCNEYMRRFENFRHWISYKEILIPVTIVFGIVTFMYVYLRDKDQPAH